VSGGYEDGYAKCPCFWGRSPGSLVRRFLSEAPSVEGLDVVDLGCGEGKNAYAFATAGARVLAIDCSEAALANAQREFSHPSITWIKCDAGAFLVKSKPFDIAIIYGLLHCLQSALSLADFVNLAIHKTRSPGYHIVAAFNDGPHDMTAHPGFLPTLVSHDFLLGLYARHALICASNEVLHETHPHNNICHFHSITRLIARL
jgi:tellurite methyltransferase